MIRSKVIPVIFAALCGIALQGSAANAQSLIDDNGVMLQPGSSLFPGSVMRTYTGYMLFLQQDGNLVLYSPSSTVLWSSQTFGNVPAYLTMQMDGNLVLYGYPQGGPGPVQQLWASNTNKPMTNLYLSDTGALLIIEATDPKLNAKFVHTLAAPGQ
jgi:hypothetical protein